MKKPNFVKRTLVSALGAAPFAILGLLVLFLVGCASNNTEIANTGDNEVVNSQETQQNEVQEETDFEENQGILTDTLTFGDEVFYGEIKTYKTSKTAEIEGIYPINDTEESFDHLGETVYRAPIMVDAWCSFMNFVTFALEEPDELNEEADNEMMDELRYYEVTKLTITFIDEEDKTQIAKCTSTEKDSIEYVAYRKYEKQDPENSITPGSFYGETIEVSRVFEKTV